MSYFSSNSLRVLCKSLAISSLVIFLFYIIFFNNPYIQSYPFFIPFRSKWSNSHPFISNPKTNISHIVFGIVGSMNTWKHKKPYIESWWRPNITRGYVFFDRPPGEDLLPWPSSSPPFRVNEDISKWKVYPRILKPIQVRIFRTILETYRQGDKDVRWFVMADDDTVLFVDNLIRVLSKYDHEKYFYIGTNSECVGSNFAFSFDMGFGGAGYALSYSLVQDLAKKLDGCIQRYPYLFVSDFMLHTCLADFGVDLTLQKGFHQIDLHNDISGLLSSHPKTPFLSLHHLDTIFPIFPAMNSSAAVNHLMTAAKVDQPRLLQQTICYHRQSNFSVSIAWGYSTQIYENILPRSFLRRPLETFRPWKNGRPPLYMFNTRWLTGDPCETPHVFFLESIQNGSANQIVTIYNRASPRGLPPCSASGNHSADGISTIKVLTPAAKFSEVEKIECCDIKMADMNTTEVNYRACYEDEIIA